MEPQSKSPLQPWNLLNKFSSVMWFAVFLLLVVSSQVIESHFLVKKLPGFPGDLPFTLETGYIGVGESDEVQLFYYFIESEGNPKDDPLMIWLTGGPGCSSLTALLYQIGIPSHPGHTQAYFGSAPAPHPPSQPGILGAPPAHTFGVAPTQPPPAVFAQQHPTTVYQPPMLPHYYGLQQQYNPMAGQPQFGPSPPPPAQPSFSGHASTHGQPQYTDLSSVFQAMSVQAPQDNNFYMDSGATRHMTFNQGPLTIDYANSTLVKTALKINPYSWTKVANIIFLDQPAGVGFSYAKTPEAYITNDTFSAMRTCHFLRKWLVDHPKFLRNPFYITGDSYNGIVVPMIAEEIYDGNEVGEGPHINIKGYILGNPLTDTRNDYNSRIPYAHRMALLSDAIYKSVDENCHGEYLNVDPNNNLCINDLKVVHTCIARIYLASILEPSCEIPQLQIQWCRDGTYLYSSTWANSRDVREALHVREEMNDVEWVRCNETMVFNFGVEPIAYTHNVLSVVGYHQRLADKNCRALVYSGDHDMKIPHFSTLNWIESLNLSVEKDWRPWFVDEQVAGYTMKFSKNEYNLTYATVKGAGHTAPQYKPKECFSMLTRWLANNPLEEVTVQLQSKSL